MDSQLEELHSAYAKKLGYDPLDCSPFSIEQRKFQKRMKSLLCQPYEFLTINASSSSFPKVKIKKRDLTSTNSFTSKPRHSSITRVLGTLKGSRRHTSRNAVILNTGEDYIEAQRNPRALSIKELYLNEKIIKSPSRTHSLKSAKLRPLVPGNMKLSRITIRQRKLNKVENYYDQDTQHKEHEHTDVNKRLFEKLGRNRERLKVIIENVSRQKIRLRNNKNFSRPHKIKLNRFMRNYKYNRT